MKKQGKTREEELKEDIRKGFIEENRNPTSAKGLWMREKAEAELKGIAEGRRLQKIEDEAMKGIKQDGTFFTRQEFDSALAFARDEGCAKALADVLERIKGDRRLKEFHYLVLWIEQKIKEQSK